MTKLLFVRKPHVYLPEISAYENYLAQHFPSITTAQSTELETYDASDYDIIWHFMGVDLHAKGRYVVHEYNSLSTRPYARVKDILKRTLNGKPDRRVFLNDTVRKTFGFKGSIPHHIRDMGIDQAFFDINQRDNPDYDFICCGGLDRGTALEKLLNHFEHNMNGATVLLVGNAPLSLQNRFKDVPNITFKGRVPYAEIPDLMANARYGLNIMPDIYPFNIQTATKVLEYAAIGLPIVSTDYYWIRQYEQQYGAKCFKLSSDLSNLSSEVLHNFNFTSPDLTHLKWDHVITESKIFSFLE